MKLMRQLMEESINVAEPEAPKVENQESLKNLRLALERIEKTVPTGNLELELGTLMAEGEQPNDILQVIKEKSGLDDLDKIEDIESPKYLALELGKALTQDESLENLLGVISDFKTSVEQGMQNDFDIDNEEEKIVKMEIPLAKIELAQRMLDFYLDKLYPKDGAAAEEN